MVPDQDAFDVCPVAVSAGEALVDEQIFRAAGRQPAAVGEIVSRSASDGALFKWDRPESDIKRNAVVILQEKNTRVGCLA